MKKILLAIESCESTTIASPIVEKTVELASAFSSKVWILHVVPPSREPPFNIDSELSRHETATELRHEHEYLQQLAKCIQDKDIDANALLVHGKIIDTILKEAEKLETDLIVMGCHRHGRFYGALMDDTEEGLVSKCAQPIMFIPT